MQLFCGWAWMTGEWHRKYMDLALSDLQSKYCFQDSPKQPRWLCTTRTVGNVCEKIETWVSTALRILILQVSGDGDSTGLCNRLLGFLWCSEQVNVNWPFHLWFLLYGSRMHGYKHSLSQQALRILYRHWHLLCVTIGYRGQWLDDRLGCRASYCVFRPNRASLLY